MIVTILVPVIRHSKNKNLIIHRIFNQNSPHSFCYTLEYVANYRSKISLHIRGNNVIVKTGRRTKITLINQFLNKHQTQIYQQLQRYEQNKKIDLKHKLPFVFINDISCHVIYRADVKRWTQQDRQLLLPASMLDIDAININKAFYQLAYKNYQIAWSKRIQTLAILINHPKPFPSLIIKNVTSFWGLCRPQQNTITLNIKLLHFSSKIIDYVILHELTHFIHPNHNSLFWNELAQVYPDYKAAIKTLKCPGL